MNGPHRDARKLSGLVLGEPEVLAPSAYDDREGGGGGGGGGGERKFSDSASGGVGRRRK